MTLALSFLYNKLAVISYYYYLIGQFELSEPFNSFVRVDCPCLRISCSFYYCSVTTNLVSTESVPWQKHCDSNSNNENINLNVNNLNVSKIQASWHKY